MSAYICDDSIFQNIAIAYHFATDKSLSAMQRTADILKRENVRSVNYRYNEKTRFKPVTFADWQSTDILPDSVILEMLSTVDYQSCERLDYDQSNAAFVNQAIRNYFAK